jgi:hypothetical protein
VDPPSESVRAATTPSLQPYEPSAWVTPSAPPTSPETPRDLLLAPIIAVAEQLSKLVLTDDDGVKEKGEIPKEEIPEGDIPEGNIPERRNPNRRAQSLKETREERRVVPKGHRALLRATRSTCRQG